MAAELEYPQREPFFAHKFTRLMMKTCLCQEIGPGAAMLLTFIVHTEDASHYRRPVMFYNDHLASLVGMTQKQFRIARDKCVETGWLVHVPGAKGRAAKYFVTIPRAASGLDDQPTDEGDSCPIPALSLPSETENRANIGQESGKNRAAVGRTFIPDPDPIPVPKEGEGIAADAAPPPVAEAPAEQVEVQRQKRPEVSNTQCQAVVHEWNFLGEPFPQIQSITESRLKAIRVRLKDPWWRENWQRGLARMPTCSFLKGGNDRNWVAGIDWFLRPNSLAKLLEGDFDDARNGQARRKPDASRVAARAGEYDG